MAIAGYAVGFSGADRFISGWIGGVVMSSKYTDYGYDIECLPNFFSIIITRVADRSSWRFIITPWCNQGKELNMFLTHLRNSNGRMVGFNNLAYDYPMVHMIMSYSGMVTNEMLYSKSQSIINADFNDWSHQI